jgi:pyrimidine operon attenuation protein/uracil phosphoribosyltransferase
MKYEKSLEKSNGQTQFIRTDTQEVKEIFTIEVLEAEKQRNLAQIAGIETRNIWLDERINEAKKLS